MLNSIVTPILEKWLTLTRRDQQAAIALLVSLTITIVIFGIILPISNARSALTTELKNAQDVLAELTTLAPQALASGRQGTQASANSINSEVRRQAARYGIEIQRFEPDGEFLKVWLEDVRYPAVVQWLGGLETLGITHTELTMEDRPKPGFVSIRVTFGVGQ